MNNQKFKKICEDNGLFYFNIDRFSCGLMEVPHSIYGAWNQRFAFHIGDKDYVVVMMGEKSKVRIFKDAIIDKYVESSVADKKNNKK